MKYVVTRDENGKEEIFIFPRNFNHDDFAEVVSHVKTYKNGSHHDWERMYREPIAAGFYDGKCSGRSETLGLDSRGAVDDALINNNR